jgi:hypothetical protein
MKTAKENNGNNEKKMAIMEWRNVNGNNGGNNGSSMA